MLHRIKEILQGFQHSNKIQFDLMAKEVLRWYIQETDNIVINPIEFDLLWHQAILKISQDN